MMGVNVTGCKHSGLIVRSSASVKATQCEFSENIMYGVRVDEGSKGIFTDCTFHDNEEDGAYVRDEGTLVELRGEQTEIHHNSGFGLRAWCNATINIYIPSRSITALVHDHDHEDGDLSTFIGGKIQSQLSSSSLELTVIHGGEAEDDDDDEDN